MNLLDSERKPARLEDWAEIQKEPIPTSERRINYFWTIVLGAAVLTVATLFWIEVAISQ